MTIKPVDSRFRGSYGLAAIVGLALILRLASIPSLHSEGYTSDELMYIFIGNNVAEGIGFIDSNGDFSTRSPLYPALLGASFFLSGSSLVIPHILSSLLGAFSVLLLFFLSKQLFGDDDSAFFAAAAMALYPSLIIYSALLQTEAFYIALFLSILIVGFRLVDNRSTTYALSLGLLCGLAALTRAVFLTVYPFFIFLFLWLGGKDRRKLYAPIGLSVVAFALVMTPWTLRNYSLHDAFVPVSTFAGTSLLLGNNPYSTGTWSTRPGFEEWMEEELERKGLGSAGQLSEVERQAASRSIAIEYMASNPIPTLSLSAKKGFMSWIYPITNSDSNVPLQAAAVGADFILLMISGLGVLLSRENRAAFLLVTGLAAIYTVTHLVLHAEARYRLPLSPVLCLFFGTALASVRQYGVRHFLKTSRERWLAGILAGVVTLLYTTAFLMFLKGSL